VTSSAQFLCFFYLFLFASKKEKEKQRKKSLNKCGVWRCHDHQGFDGAIIMGIIHLLKYQYSQLLSNIM